LHSERLPPGHSLGINAVIDGNVQRRSRDSLEKVRRRSIMDRHLLPPLIEK
jgi:hypothetical protein